MIERCVWFIAVSGRG